MQLATSKVREVKSFFEEPQNYFSGRSVEIEIRTETVRELTEGFAFRSVLDIGCGDGSISVPLLSKDTHLTLLDLATNMTLLARSRVPAELSDNVTCLNDNFMTVKLNPQSYDLVICLGVLAHLDSPADFLKKVKKVLKPKGRLILGFTDSQHLSGRTLRTYQYLSALRKPRTWKLNALSVDLVSRMLGGEQLRITSAFRYGLPPLPIINKRLSPDILYRMVRRVFGSARFNRNTWLGNEYICLVTHDE